MKWLKRFLKFLLVTTILAAVIMGISALILYTIDVNRHKDLIVKKISQITGQELKIEGLVDVKLIPLPSIELNNVTWSVKLKGKKIQATAEQVKFNIPFRSLWSNETKLEEIDAKNVWIYFFEKEKTIEKSLFIENVVGEVLTSCCDLQLSVHQLRSGKNDLTGTFRIDYEPIPQITGKASIKQWEMPLSSDPNNKTEDFFTISPDFLEWLAVFQADLEIHADRFVFEKQEMQDANFKLTVKEKALTIVPQVQLSKDRLTGKGVIQKDQKTGMPLLSAQFSLKQQNAQETLEGNLVFLFLKDTTKITGRLQSPTWRLALADPTKSNEKISLDLFSVKKFKNVSYEIDYHTDELQFQKLKLNNAIVKLRLKDNLLTLSPKGELAWGHFTGELKIKEDPSRMLPQVSGEFSLLQADAALFFKMLSPGAKLEDGKLNVRFKGHSKGVYEADLLANLSGDLLVHVEKMEILNQRIDERYVDLFASLWKKLLPTHKNTTLECGAMRMKIKNGYARSENSIGLDSQELFVLGTGGIDLKSKKLDFTFTLSGRSNFNLEIGNYDNIVLLKGTLDQPRLTGTAHGLIKEGGSLLLGYATGGISIVAEKLFKVMSQKGSPCHKILSQQES